MEQNTPKQKWTLIASVVLLIIIIVAAVLWDISPTPPLAPESPSEASNRPTAITSIEGIVKVLAGGAIYIETDDPAEVLAGIPTPKKTILIALTSRATEYISYDSVVPPAPGEAPPEPSTTAPGLKPGDRIVVTSSKNLVGIPANEPFDVTRIEVIR